MALNETDVFEAKVAIDHVVLNFFLTFDLLIVGDVVIILGIIGNVVNVFNFKAEGFKESYNITLTALALSDIGALVTQLLVNVTLVPFWDDIDQPFASFFLLTTAFMYPNAYFVRVSGLLTSLGAIERCLCVVLPLSVRRIITRQVTLAAIVIIFTSLIPPLFCYNYYSYLDWAYDPAMNKTVISLINMDEAFYILPITYLVTDMCIPYLTFFILIVCTTIIGIQLKSKSAWRRQFTGKNTLKDTKSKLSNREMKAVLMLTAISLIYIICLAPQSALVTALAFENQLAFAGKYFDILRLCLAFTYVLEIIACSINIIVYYKMSSKYQKRMQQWLLTFLTR